MISEDSLAFLADYVQIEGLRLAVQEVLDTEIAACRALMEAALESNQVHVAHAMNGAIRELRELPGIIKAHAAKYRPVKI